MATQPVAQPTKTQPPVQPAKRQMVERKARTQKWEVAGDFVEGKLVKIETVNYKDGVGARYHVVDKDGTIVLMAGTTMINLLLLRSDVGKWIQVVYKGEDMDAKISAGNTNRPKLFDVYVEEKPAAASTFADGTMITDDDIPF